MPIKMVRAVRCNSCGLVYPENIFQEWGRKWGRGIGKQPKCEGLQSRYNRGPMTTKPNGSRIPGNEIMHPLHVCRGSLSVVDITEDEAFANAAIPATEDRNYVARVKILRQKQEEHSPLIKSMRATA